MFKYVARMVNSVVSQKPCLNWVNTVCTDLSVQTLEYLDQAMHVHRMVRSQFILFKVNSTTFLIFRSTHSVNSSSGNLLSL